MYSRDGDVIKVRVTPSKTGKRGESMVDTDGASRLSWVVRHIY